MSNPEAFSKEWHDELCKNHSNENGHYCSEWDDMYICEDCSEFRCCACFNKSGREILKEKYIDALQTLRLDAHPELLGFFKRIERYVNMLQDDVLLLQLDDSLL